MGQRLNARSAKWPKLLVQATDRLVAQYGTPTLGNFRNPVKEIFYIVLSARTTERLYQRACKQLFERFPTIDLVATAKVKEILECVKVAGLGRKRAVQLIAIATRLTTDLGKNPQHRLRKMTPREVFGYLTSLPGVGPKSALCIMMCSLDLDVFPVDINVQRIFERLGTVRKGLKHYQAQKLVPKYVPEGRSKELHVGLVEHGRRVCLPNRPKCDVCLLSDMCRHGKKNAKTRRIGSGM